MEKYTFITATSNDNQDILILPPLDCLLNSLHRLTRKDESSSVLALCDGNPPVTGGFPSQGASNAERVVIAWRLHVMINQQSRASEWNALTRIAIAITQERRNSINDAL